MLSSGGEASEHLFGVIVLLSAILAFIPAYIYLEGIVIGLCLPKSLFNFFTSTGCLCLLSYLPAGLEPRFLGDIDGGEYGDMNWLLGLGLRGSVISEGWGLILPRGSLLNT